MNQEAQRARISANPESTIPISWDLLLVFNHSLCLFRSNAAGRCAVFLGSMPPNMFIAVIESHHLLFDTGPRLPIHIKAGCNKRNIFTLPCPSFQLKLHRFDISLPNYW